MAVSLGTAWLAFAQDQVGDQINSLRLKLFDAKSTQSSNFAPVDRDLDQVPLVLMYHDIVNDALADLSKEAAIERAKKLHTKGPEEPSSDVLRTDFQDQLTWLRQHGYHTVTIDQFYRAMVEYPRFKLPPKSVLLTFDDGYSGNRTIKDDLMKHTYGFGGTFFIHSHFTGAEASAEDRARDPWAKDHLNEEDLQDLQYDAKTKTMDCDAAEASYSGCYQVESHTWSHPRLDQLITGPGTTWDGLPTNLEKEMRVPREGLRPSEMGKQTRDDSITTYLSQDVNWAPVPGHPELREKKITPHPEAAVHYLAYPFGRFTREGQHDHQVMAAAQKAGYKMAFMIGWPGASRDPWRIHNIYAIPRMEVTLSTWVHEGDARSRTLPSFEEQIRSWKTRYKATLLRAHDPEPNFTQPLETIDP